ncbi:hypothetical protein HZH68_003397 [Vespula germanica]|uniref:Uncharacterized protein n=1 Tax=Vespula germanica TaxID=30212 RepID=A0A834NP43_VESGE|nr:hypothetical protein HZH68_003397 [Vespula germanica]
MRRFARGRKILAAFSAIMGRLGKGSQNATRPIFRVHYRKLVDEYSQQQQEQLKFMPALPDYMSYCCCRCGHTQKLKLSKISKRCRGLKRPLEIRLRHVSEHDAIFLSSYWRTREPLAGSRSAVHSIGCFIFDLLASERTLTANPKPKTTTTTTRKSPSTVCTSHGISESRLALGTAI